ncbi:MAG: hypothetical protein AMXMBFR46_25150 [Acidimicrobiia bacterium]
MPYARSPGTWASPSAGDDLLDGRPRDRRPKVLLEYADYGVAFAAERILERHGYAVAVCGGPDHLRGRQCPLVASGTCPLVEGADVVLNGLDLTRRENRAVLAAVRGASGERRVIVEVSEPVSARHRELLEGTEIVLFPMRAHDLVEAVEHSLERRSS